MENTATLSFLKTDDGYLVTLSSLNNEKFGVGETFNVFATKEEVLKMKEEINNLNLS